MSSELYGGQDPRALTETDVDKCGRPGCLRAKREGADYCCAPCALMDMAEVQPMAHTRVCDARTRPGA